MSEAVVRNVSLLWYCIRLRGALFVCWITGPPPVRWRGPTTLVGRLFSGSDVDPAVYVERLAGDVVAVLDEVADGAGYLFGLAEATERDGLQELTLRLLGDGGDHVRLYKAGADRVHGDAVAGELLGGGLGEAEQARLGGRVVGLADVTGLAHEGAHVDDLAAALLHHVRQRRVQRVEGAVKVYLDDLVPILDRELLQGAIYVYAGVVHQHVYPVELLYRLVYQALGLLGNRDVGLDRYRARSALLEPADQLLRRLLAPRVVDNDVRPATPQLLRYGGPQ